MKNTDAVPSKGKSESWWLHRIAPPRPREPVREAATA